MNENLMCSEARRLAMELANFCREYPYLMPLDIPFPGLRIHVVAEQITSVEDTQPFGTIRRVDEDDARAD